MGKKQWILKAVERQKSRPFRKEYIGKEREEVRKKAIGDEKIITCRPADLLEPELPKYTEETKGIAKSEEDVLSYALFPQVAAKFFEFRDKKETKTEEKVLIVEDLS